MFDCKSSKFFYNLALVVAQKYLENRYTIFYYIAIIFAVNHTANYIYYNQNQYNQ